VTATVCLACCCQRSGHESCASFHLLRAAASRQRVIGLTSAAGLLVGTVTGLAGGPAAGASTQTYTVTDLGNLGFPESFGLGINTAGEVVGYSYLKKTVRASLRPAGDIVGDSNGSAFLIHDGKISQVGPAGFRATASNDTGHIVGYINSHACALGGTRAPNLLIRRLFRGS